MKWAKITLIVLLQFSCAWSAFLMLLSRQAWVANSKHQIGPPVRLLCIRTTTDSGIRIAQYSRLLRVSGRSTDRMRTWASISGNIPESFPTAFEAEYAAIKANRGEEKD
jgi:hypothetical protein